MSLNEVFQENSKLRIERIYYTNTKFEINNIHESLGSVF